MQSVACSGHGRDAHAAARQASPRWPQQSPARCPVPPPPRPQPCPAGGPLHAAATRVAHVCASVSSAATAAAAPELGQRRQEETEPLARFEPSEEDDVPYGRCAGVFLRVLVCCSNSGVREHDRAWRELPARVGEPVQQVAAGAEHGVCQHGALPLHEIQLEEFCSVAGERREQCGADRWCRGRRWHRQPPTGSASAARPRTACCGAGRRASWSVHAEQVCMCLGVSPGHNSRRRASRVAAPAQTALHAPAATASAGSSN